MRNLFQTPAVCLAMALFAGISINANAVPSELPTLEEGLVTRQQKSLAEIKFEEAKKKLAVLWKRMSPELKNLLDSEQKEWLKNRNSQCEDEAAKETDLESHRIVEFSCLAEMTQKRTLDLRNIKAKYAIITEGNKPKKDLGTLPKKTRKKLSEDEWKNEQEIECSNKAATESPLDASLAEIIKYECLTEMTKARAERLKRKHTKTASVKKSKPHKQKTVKTSKKTK